mmetsp:Transcript_10976/g.28198  ORF Transcript_10976/g.28198 Transcript_10976/m.28198 type:complete len:303 (+) Transcript_10976:447-1355(+)
MPRHLIREDREEGARQGEGRRVGEVQHADGPALFHPQQGLFAVSTPTDTNDDAKKGSQDGGENGNDLGTRAGRRKVAGEGVEEVGPRHASGAFLPLLALIIPVARLRQNPFHFLAAGGGEKRQGNAGQVAPHGLEEAAPGVGAPQSPAHAPRGDLGVRAVPRMPLAAQQGQNRGDARSTGNQQRRCGSIQGPHAAVGPFHLEPLYPGAAALAGRPLSGGQDAPRLGALPPEEEAHLRLLPWRGDDGGRVNLRWNQAPAAGDADPEPLPDVRVARQAGELQVQAHPLVLHDCIPWLKDFRSTL